MLGASRPGSRKPSLAVEQTHIAPGKRSLVGIPGLRLGIILSSCWSLWFILGSKGRAQYDESSDEVNRRLARKSAPSIDHAAVAEHLTRLRDTLTTLKVMNTSRSPSILTLSEQGLEDFPCSLRDDENAHRCAVDCVGDIKCDRAHSLCDYYQECTHILLEKRGDHAAPWAVLKRMTTMEASSNRVYDLRARSWVQIQPITRLEARYYVVSSFGGSGSKMLAGFLADKFSISRNVFHVHDPHPPKRLYIKPGRTRGKWSHDARQRSFLGGERFSRDDEGADATDSPEAYRVVLLLKDPAEALVSRFGMGHCEHLQGDCFEALALVGGDESSFPPLCTYAEHAVDWMGLTRFVLAYLDPAQPRDYRVVVLNYHKLWSRLPLAFDALGLPRSLISSFPQREETRRGGGPEAEVTRKLLREMYRELSDLIYSLPAVMYV